LGVSCNAWLLVWGAIGVLTAACSAQPDAPTPDESAIDARPNVVWTDVGSFAVANARTATITVDIGPASRFVAIRVSPQWTGKAPKKRTVCYQLDRVGTDGKSWVGDSRVKRDWGPACTGCSQRTASMRGYGLFVFPNDGSTLEKAPQLRMRVVLRNCETGVSADDYRNPDMPASVLVQSATESAPLWGTDGQLRLRVAFANGVTPGSLDVRWNPAFESAAKQFAAAGLNMKVERVAHIDKPTDDVTHGHQGDTTAALLEKALQALRDPAAAESARFVPIVIAPCLRHATAQHGTKVLLGLSKRIPGGFVPAAAQTGLDGVILAPRGCDPSSAPLSPERLGTLLAHEVGHYLGLYHSDSKWADHRPAAKGDIMQSDAALGQQATPAFTSAQAVVINRHPIVWFDPSTPAQ